MRMLILCIICISNNAKTQIALPKYVDANTQKSRFSYNKTIITVQANAPRRLRAILAPPA